MPVSHTKGYKRTETLRKKMLADAAARWNAAGLRYSVVHGAEQYPARMGRDIDVMAESSSEETIIAATLSTFRENGWTATAHKMTVGVTRVIGHCTEDGTTHAAEIDVASTGLRWGPVVFLDSPSPIAECARRGPFVIDLWGSFVKRILIQALSGNVECIERRPAEMELSDWEATIAEERLTEFANAALASDFVNAVQAKDLGRLRTCSRALRVALLRESLRGHRLTATMRGTLAWIKDRLALNVFMRKAAPVVALVGPEGIDKSAVIEAMHQSMRRELVFPAMQVRHWPLSPGLTHSIANGTPSHHTASAIHTESTAPQSKGSAWTRGAHLARCMLSYLSVHLLKDRKCSAGLQLVVYDQWLLDTLVHVMHYVPFSGMRTILHLLPRPDLIILLQDGSAGIGTQCVAPPSRLNPPLKAWQKLVELGYIDVVLVADAPPAELARRVIHAVVDVFTEMHGGDELRKGAMRLE